MLSSADVKKLEGFLPKSGKSSPEYLDQRFRIEMLMRQPAISVQSHQAIEDAARLLVTHAIHALPVVNAQNHLIGILTTTDLMQALLNMEPGPKESTDTPRDSASVEWQPTPAAIERALGAARGTVLAKQDADGVAQALLYLQKRVVDLEEAERLVRRYLTVGQNEAATLMKALETAAR